MNYWLKILFVFFIFLIVIVLISLQYTDGYRYMYINYNDIYELDKEYKYKKRIKNCIISLTTTPDRLKEIKPNLMSLLDSSVAVEEIRLNIPYYSCKGVKYRIPKWLKKLKSINICRTEKDWGPATKLLPTLLDHKTKKIIVVDDDVIYGYYMVETLNRSFENYNRNGKKVAVTMYGDKFGENNSMDYTLTSRAKNYIIGECYTDVLRGHSAYMVTPNMFTKDIYNYRRAPKECFFVDDNYFSWHLKKNRVKILMVGLNYKAVPLPDMTNCFTGALHQNHNGDGHNERVVNRYYNKKK